MGRGAVKNIIRLASGSVIVMLDADFPVRPSDIYRAVQIISDGRADLVRADLVAKWYVPDAMVRDVRALIRHRMDLTRERTQP